MAYVNPLDATTPLGSDPVSQGDDMFRSVKAALIERIDSFFTGHDVQPWQAKSGAGAASLWVVSDAVEAVTRLAYTGAGSRSVELFANATVAGLRDTTGPLTILSYTYSSALTVLNTTGSMQLKVGVGQTIQTVVNGVTVGTWSSTGFTVAAGTTAVQALVATTVHGTGAATFDAGVTVTGNAVISGLYATSANTLTFLGGATDTRFKNAANNADNVIIADSGAMTVRAGLTVSAGGLTVVSGTTSLQIVTPTQLGIGMTPVYSVDVTVNLNGGAIMSRWSDTDNSAATNSVMQFKRLGSVVGGITETQTATQFVTSSDQRLKTDRGIASSVESLSVLRALTVHDFTWKADGTKARGVFAQEAYNVAPYMIHVGDDAADKSGNLLHPWGADYSKLVPDLVVGWQDHEARLLALEARS